MDRKRLCTTVLMAGLCLFAALAGWHAGRGPGLLCAVLALLLLFCLCAFWLMRVILRRGAGLLSNVGIHRGSRARQNEQTRVFIAHNEALLAPLGWQDVTIPAQDGTALHAYYIPGAPGEMRTVVLLHGYSRRALQMADYALFWQRQLGVNVLMPDARAHGQSGGRYCGMSYYEKHDALLWLDWLLQRYGPGAQIALHGISMGASTAISAAGCAPPPQLKMVVADCGFTDAYSEFAYQFRHRFHLPVFPLLPLVALFARAAAGYWMREASALRYAPHVAVPVLFIHGTADNFVPTVMVHPLYKAVACADKRLLLIPGAPHVRAFYVGAAAYRAAVEELAGQYLR